MNVSCAGGVSRTGDSRRKYRRPHGAIDEFRMGWKGARGGRGPSTDLREKVKETNRFLNRTVTFGLSQVHAEEWRGGDCRHDANNVVGGRGMAGQPSGPLSGLLPAENRT